MNQIDRLLTQVTIEMGVSADNLPVSGSLDFNLTPEAIEWIARLMQSDRPPNWKGKTTLDE